MVKTTEGNSEYGLDREEDANNYTPKTCLSLWANLLDKKEVPILQ